MEERAVVAYVCRSALTNDGPVDCCKIFLISWREGRECISGTTNN